MDAPKVKSWRNLTTYVVNKDYWKAIVRYMRQPRVRYMRQPRICVKIGSHVKEGGWGEHLTLSCNGAEDAVIATAISAACIHHNTQRKYNAHNALRKLCVSRRMFVVCCAEYMQH